MTDAGKITTARLEPGARILVDEPYGRLIPATRKRGARSATVLGTERYRPIVGRQVRVLVRTDLGEIACSPSQTFWMGQ